MIRTMLATPGGQRQQTGGTASTKLPVHSSAKNAFECTARLQRKSGIRFGSVHLRGRERLCGRKPKSALPIEQHYGVTVQIAADYSGISRFCGGNARQRTITTRSAFIAATNLLQLRV